MPWEPINLSDKEIKEFVSQNKNKKKCKFLVDGNLGEGIAILLRDEGWNAKYIDEYGLTGHDDNKVYRTAYREGRMLLTHDTDFLDNRLFPLNISPGVVILSGGSGNNKDLFTGLNLVITFIADYQEIFSNSKIVVSSGGEITISRINNDGVLEKNKYKVTPSEVLRWVE